MININLKTFKNNKINLLFNLSIFEINMFSKNLNFKGFLPYFFYKTLYFYKKFNLIFINPIFILKCFLFKYINLFYFFFKKNYKIIYINNFIGSNLYSTNKDFFNQFFLNYFIDFKNIYFYTRTNIWSFFSKLWNVFENFYLTKNFNLDYWNLKSIGLIIFFNIHNSKLITELHKTKKPLITFFNLNLKKNYLNLFDFILPGNSDSFFTLYFYNFFFFNLNYKIINNLRYTKKLLSF